ncbi:unnamed protein product [Peniophora sp. CBMAI 1063]|nr:unnamed protein product [Peniophora sp. CBMAI 1063]
MHEADIVQSSSGQMAQRAFWMESCGDSRCVTISALDEVKPYPSCGQVLLYTQPISASVINKTLTVHPETQGPRSGLKCSIKY